MEVLENRTAYLGMATTPHASDVAVFIQYSNIFVFYCTEKYIYIYICDFEKRSYISYIIIFF